MVPVEKLVFVEFVATKIPVPGALHYFVGRNIKEVFAVTNNGKRFSILEFSSHREITAEEARSLGLQPLDEAVTAICEMGYRSHKLRASRK